MVATKLWLVTEKQLCHHYFLNKHKEALITKQVEERRSTCFLAVKLKLHHCQFGGAAGGFCAVTIIVQESEFLHCCRLEVRWGQTSDRCQMINIITISFYRVGKLVKISRDSFRVKILKSNQLPRPTHSFGVLGRCVGRSQNKKSAGFQLA